MSAIGCVATSDAINSYSSSKLRRNIASTMPVVSPRRFSSGTSTSSTSLTGSYRPTLTSSTSFDRPYYSSATSSYITSRSSSRRITDFSDKRFADKTSSYSRHSSFSEDSGISTTSRYTNRSDKSESRESSVRRDGSINRNDSHSLGLRNDRSRESSIAGRRLSSTISIANSVDDMRKKYSPSNYVPNVRKPESKADFGRSKSISNDIGRPPIETKGLHEARSSINRKNKVTKSTELFVNGVSVPNTNTLNAARKIDGSSIEKYPKTSAADNCVANATIVEGESTWSKIELDDDNGNIPLSVSEIRKKFDTSSGHTTIPNYIKNSSVSKYDVSQVHKTNDLSVSCQNLKLSNQSVDQQNNGNNVRWTFLSNSDKCSPDVDNKLSGNTDLSSLSKDDKCNIIKIDVQQNLPSTSKLPSNHTSNFASYIPVSNFENKSRDDKETCTEIDLAIDEIDSSAPENTGSENTKTSTREFSATDISISVGDLDMSRDYNSRKQGSSRGIIPPNAPSRYNHSTSSIISDISTSPRSNRSSLGGGSPTPQNAIGTIRESSVGQRASNSLERDKSRERSYERSYGNGSVKSQGLNGLRNIGNTCFMNSVIQCLSNTRYLLEYLKNDGYLNDINTTTSGMKGALVKAFSTVIQELWSADSDKIVNTTAFKSQVQRFAARFMGYAQQDAQEFLRYLLEGLHEDVNRVTVKPTPIITEIDEKLSDSQKATEAWSRYLRMDDSAIVDVFVGQLKSTLKCTVCGHCSVTFDPFWDLSLPLASSSLTQCLEHFTREETLDGHEKPTCAKCQQHRKCTKSFSIQKFPKILVLHLKRFSPMERFRGKLSTLVDFPLHGLDLSAFAANKNAGGCVYNLYAVSNHSGTTYSGHYTAYCKHPYSNEWHEYNDSRVSSISPRSVISSEAYLLFYELSGQSSHL